MSAEDFGSSDQVGTIHSATCLKADEASGSTVFGTDIYSGDSSICSAAVHVGLITPQEGGQVTFQILAGLDAYEGSKRNGITTRSWGAWGSSFQFVSDGQ